jgi:hypothetical protein
LAVEAQLTILDPDQVGYRLLQELVPGQTFLCADVSENIVILKRLEDDCLHCAQLHPSIKDRLARVRELAHARIATLRSVERFEGSACLVWVYLDGEPWDDSLDISTLNLLKLCGGLAAGVDALHEIGIVHGNIHGRNIIVRPDRQVWLTHVSPYLYTDPNADIGAVIELLRQAGERLPSGVSGRFSLLVNQLETGEHTLREFSHLVLDTMNEPAESDSFAVVIDRGYRFSSLFWAALIAVFCAVIWFVIHRQLAQPKPSIPATCPSLRPNRF